MKLMTTLLAPALLLSQIALADTKVPEGTYKIDVAHSKVGFEVSHLVVATVEGKFSDFEGTFVIDPKLDKSTIDVNIKSTSVNTDNKDRDDHLRSPDFFDSKKYEKLTFKSKKITGTPENLKVSGDLTIRGVTKPVTLDAKYTGSVKDPWGNERVAFRASTKINRKDFGLSWHKAVEVGPVVGDEVTLDLRVEAIKEKVAKK
ncbi:YceI family protein [Bdellovibrio sp. HCB337]|uniref:YceI family protein n=1 Tax=Bdellovibrio sp. HCB337 TaxID=3394358 RepID=UPI0039A62A4A